MIKKLFKIFTLVIAVILVVLVVAINIMMGSQSQKTLINELDNLGITVKLEDIDYEEFTINTIQVGDVQKPKVLFVHGSPGRWFDWINMYKSDSLRQHFCLTSYDRPGLGLTTVPAKEKLGDQAKIAAAVMKHYQQNGETYIVAGHSYGGAVTEQILLDYPDLIEKAIYAGPTVSPEMQEIKWYNQLANFGLIKMLLPKGLRSSNHEMMGLQSCLDQNTERLASITTPIVFIQGKKDVLVPFETVAYYKKHKPSGVRYVIMEEMNHFIPWSDPELVIDAILW